MPTVRGLHCVGLDVITSESWKPLEVFVSLSESPYNETKLEIRICYGAALVEYSFHGFDRPGTVL